jgi:hypothetical protein
MPVGPGDFVKVTYKGRDVPTRDATGVVTGVRRDDEKPLTLMWDSRPYLCEVGKETFVPFEAAMVAFGDPRSATNMATIRDQAGNVMFVSDRATEVRRLRTLYDNQVGPEGEILYAPDAEVTDVEGEPITTVLTDPEGESVTPVETTVLDREQLLAQLQRQQRMIEQLAAAQGIDVSSDDTGTTPADDTTPVDDTSTLPPADPFAQPPEDQ